MFSVLFISSTNNYRPVLTSGNWGRKQPDPDDFQTGCRYKSRTCTLALWMYSFCEPTSTNHRMGRHLRSSWKNKKINYLWLSRVLFSSVRPFTRTCATSINTIFPAHHRGRNKCTATRLISTWYTTPPPFPDGSVKIGTDFQAIENELHTAPRSRLTLRPRRLIQLPLANPSHGLHSFGHKGVSSSTERTCCNSFWSYVIIITAAHPPLSSALSSRKEELLLEVGRTVGRTERKIRLNPS